MKWFKHMTNAHRDEKLQRLQDELGLEGYGAYWVVLEILAEQIKDDEKDFCEYSMKFWQNSLGFSPKKLQNFLKILAKFEIFLVKFSQNSVIIKCPKIKTIRDEYTEKKIQKIGTNSRQTPDSLKDKEEDKELEKENKKEKENFAIGHSPDENANLISEAVEHVKNAQPLPTYQNDKTDTTTAQQTALEFTHDQNSKPQKQKKVSGNDALEGEFVQWYGLYPLKVAKQNAKKAFFNARKKVSLETLINGLESYKKNKPEYAQWAHPASWLNAGRWEDETPSNKTIVPVNTKREALFFAYKNQMPLRHITLGVLTPERLTPVDARYQPVEIESAKMIRVDNGNAYGLQEFSTA